MLSSAAVARLCSSARRARHKGSRQPRHVAIMGRKPEAGHSHWEMHPTTWNSMVAPVSRLRSQGPE